MANKVLTKFTKFFARAFNPLSKVFKDDESRFRLVTTFKITMIPLFSLLTMLLLLAIVLEMTLNMFKGFGPSNLYVLEGVFYDYALRSFWETMPYITLLLGFQALLGIYLSHLFLRPFRTIGEYCERVISGEEDVSYDPDFYTDLKLLTNFGEYFFNMTENILKNKDFRPINIPTKFMKIHQPVFERDFFIQYSFFIIVNSIVFGIFIHVLLMDVFDEVTSFANNTLPLGQQLQLFLQGQVTIVQNVFWVIVGWHIILNIVLSFHLYSKVSGPAFGIFATMRSFLKGNTRSRVHLIGHYYVRKHCRTLNKYLDYVERNCK